MRQRGNCRISESGVSEIIGALILISMIVLVVAVIAAFLVNRPASNEIPEVRFSVVNVSQYDELGIYSINLTHTGGDDLNPGEYSFFINDNSFPVPSVDITYPRTDKWSVGKTVMINSSVIPEYIRVYYYNTTKVNNPALLGQRSVGTSGSVGPLPIIFTIMPSVSGGNGAISPATIQTVNPGTTPTFTFTPAPGYYLNTVTVDGDPVTPVGNSYTFPAVTADHSIVGTFSINQYQYTITPSVSGGNGAISPATIQTVNSGTTPTFTFTPAPGYYLNTVTVDGNSVTPVGNSYTFPAVTANHIIIGTFAIIQTQYTITPSVFGGNGTVSPATIQTVNSGASPTFTFTPASGYQLNNVTVDGNPVTPAGNSYTFPAVTANHNIVGRFTAIPCPSVIADFKADSQQFCGGPYNVQFTDLSTGTGLTYLWNFGDSTTSPNKNPSHLYTSPGVYTVSLTVTNNCGNSNTKTINGFIVAASGSYTKDDLEPLLSSKNNCLFNLGYKNNKNYPICVPIGEQNKFTSQPFDRGQPEIFYPGIHNNVFSVSMPANTKIKWHLTPSHDLDIEC